MLQVATLSDLEEPDQFEPHKIANDSLSDLNLGGAFSLQRTRYRTDRPDLPRHSPCVSLLRERLPHKHPRQSTGRAHICVHALAAHKRGRDRHIHEAQPGALVGREHLRADHSGGSAWPQRNRTF